MLCALTAVRIHIWIVSLPKVSLSSDGTHTHARVRKRSSNVRFGIFNRSYRCELLLLRVQQRGRLSWNISYACLIAP